MACQNTTSVPMIGCCDTIPPGLRVVRIDGFYEAFGGLETYAQNDGRWTGRQSWSHFQFAENQPPQPLEDRFYTTDTPAYLARSYFDEQLSVSDSLGYEVSGYYTEHRQKYYHDPLQPADDRDVFLPNKTTYENWADLFTPWDYEARWATRSAELCVREWYIPGGSIVLRRETWRAYRERNSYAQFVDEMHDVAAQGRLRAEAWPWSYYPFVVYLGAKLHENGLLPNPARIRWDTSIPSCSGGHLYNTIQVGPYQNELTVIYITMGGINVPACDWHVTQAGLRCNEPRRITGIRLTPDKTYEKVSTQHSIALESATTPPLAQCVHTLCRGCQNNLPLPP